MAIMVMKQYLASGQVHTDKDEVIDGSQVRQTQEVINQHVSCLLKIFQCVEGNRQQDRHRQTRINHSGNASVLTLLLKDHKVLVEGQPPATRPVGGPGINLHLSDLVADNSIC